MTRNDKKRDKDRQGTEQKNSQNKTEAAATSAKTASRVEEEEEEEEEAQEKVKKTCERITEQQIKSMHNDSNGIKPARESRSFANECATIIRKAAEETYKTNQDKSRHAKFARSEKSPMFSAPSSSEPSRF